MNFNHLKQNKKNLFLAAAVLWLLVCVFVTPVFTTVTLTFESDPHGEVVTTVFAGPGANITARDDHHRVVVNGVARIFYGDIQYGSHCSLKRIDPLDQHYSTGEPLTITELTVKKNGIQTVALTGDELRTYFTVNGDLELIGEEGFTFRVTGEDSQLLPTEAFQTLYAQTPFAVRLLGALGSGILLVLAVLLVRWFARTIAGQSLFFKLTSCVLFGGLFAATLMTVFTGFWNPFYLNPDEYHTLSAVNYYFSHFMPPDMRDPEILDSYAIYGTTRHSEWTVFYFLTAKIGQFFSDPIIRVRFFTTVTFCVMAGIALKNVKKNWALFAMLLLTPQVWYLFSYCTSDSLDFFVSFLCMYQVMKKDSMLNRVLDGPFCKKQLLPMALLGLLFVQPLWGKPTFYVVLIFIFLVLLIRLFYTPLEKRKILLWKYLGIVGFTLGIFLVRYLITDFPYYGLFDKYRVYMDMMEQTALPEYKLSTPALERAYSMSFMEKGVTLGELLTGFDFNKNLFRTFAGFFGSYAFGARDWYYTIMAILYLAIIGYLLARAYRRKDSRTWWEIGAAAVAMLIQYALIVYNAWVVDFQPQGRYLLPILFYVAYLIHRADCEGKSKVLQILLCLTCLLSLYSFYRVGIPNLVSVHGIQA